MQPTGTDFSIRALGDCRVRSPLLNPAHDGGRHPHFVDDSERLLLSDKVSAQQPSDPAASLELAGPRQTIYFDASKTRIGVVTCGGLCPGLNAVIRGLVMEAFYRYGVKRIYGFRYGYQGFIPEFSHDVIELEPETVSDINDLGGTILGSSRGEQDPGKIVDCLERMAINILFVIGGDGTIRGALAVADEVARRGLKIAVVGVPKTIDNDILFIDRSFGFETAYSVAVEVICAAHAESKGGPNGVGLVKVMGRHSGFIACHAALASSDVNYVLIPEVNFKLEGPGGFLENLYERLKRRNHAVVLVAEGAGQEHLETDPAAKDASGNVRLGDIGEFLAERIRRYFKEKNAQLTLKYIDPSYVLRSVPANAPDSVYCWRLAQNAVHAAMAGKTEMVVGSWHGRLVHVPMRRAIAGRKTVDPDGDLWLSVLESTGQPPAFG